MRQSFSATELLSNQPPMHSYYSLHIRHLWRVRPPHLTIHEYSQLHVRMASGRFPFWTLGSLALNKVRYLMQDLSLKGNSNRSLGDSIINLSHCLWAKASCSMSRMFQLRLSHRVAIDNQCRAHRPGHQRTSTRSINCPQSPCLHRIAYA